LQNYIIPIFVGSNLFGQTEPGLFSKARLGFSHSTYSSLSFSSMSIKPFNKEEGRMKREHSKVTEIQYGFDIGVFLWVPLNENIIYKPKIECSFTNICLQHPGPVYATSFDVSLSQGFAIALNEPDVNGRINMAKDMTCYLTSKQQYFLIGPKANLKKFDAGYIQKGYQNEVNLGGFIGYGINYDFQGINIAQEISYSVSTTAQNGCNAPRKIAHTITLTLNFF
ncbi:MAG: hypothetical protein ABIP51_01350, partial [Bacteroidia bacterium]